MVRTKSEFSCSLQKYKKIFRIFNEILVGSNPGNTSGQVVVLKNETDFYI